MKFIFIFTEKQQKLNKYKQKCLPKVSRRFVFNYLHNIRKTEKIMKNKKYVINIGRKGFQLFLILMENIFPFLRGIKVSGHFNFFRKCLLQTLHWPWFEVPGGCRLQGRAQRHFIIFSTCLKQRTPVARHFNFVYFTAPKLQTIFQGRHKSGI